MIGRTLTSTFKIETRQYELFNFDLGEGVPRKQLAFGAAVCVVWWVVCLIAFRGINQYSLSVYIIPPIMFVALGFQDSKRLPRRKNVTEWAIRLRYFLVGHRPIIALGARAAAKSEYRPLVSRLPLDLWRRYITPWKAEAAWEREKEPTASEPIQTGRPIDIQPKFQVLGFDHMQKLRENDGRKRVRK